MRGCSFQKWDGPMDYWNIVTGPDDEKGINGGLIRRHGPAPADGQAVNSYVCTVEVASIDDCVASALSAKGTLALAKFPIPDIGWMAYVKDTEGNILGLIEKP
jgi:predicted enzyme related to lactoylglutathione lyase